MSTKLDLINIKLKELLDINEVENMKYELYGIVTTLILSKEYFKKNSDVRQFLKELSLNYREYVYNSRTTLLARVIRDIEKLNFEEINIFANELIYTIKTIKINEKSISSDESNNIKRIKKKDSNYMEDLLKKYSRNKRE